MRFPRCGKRAQSDKYVPSSHVLLLHLILAVLASDSTRSQSDVFILEQSSLYQNKDKQKLWQELQVGSFRKSTSSSQGTAFNKQTSRQHRGDPFNPFCSLAESFSRFMPLPSGGNQDNLKRKLTRRRRGQA
ncbi:hypothetical protein HN011_005087 [Eciton burchellii]|nr:hypothetical protein HN011_005087 [Eciton burchellii]